jgi:hypothetical protein
VRRVRGVLRPGNGGERVAGEDTMNEHEMRERVARFERALVAIAAQKPDGALLTTEDEDRAAWVADAVSRYEAQQRTVRPRTPPSPEEVPAKRPRRPRRRRSSKAATAAPGPKRRPGRPRKASVTPAAEG